MTYESFEVFIATGDDKGIPYKPINNAIVFETPLKFMPKCIWACKDNETNVDFAVLFSGIVCNETKEFKKIIDGTVFQVNEEINTKAQMIFTGNENGIEKLFLIFKTTTESK